MDFELSLEPLSSMEVFRHNFQENFCIFEKLSGLRVRKKKNSGTVETCGFRYFFAEKVRHFVKIKSLFTVKASFIMIHIIASS